MTYTKTNNEPKLFILAQKALMDVINQIPDDKWDEKTSSDVTNMSGEIETYRKLINYHAYDDAWVPLTYSGKAINDESGPKMDDNFLGNNPKEGYRKHAQAAIDFMENFNDLDLTVHYSYGDYPAAEALNHITLFRTLRTIDFGRSLGINVKLPEELAQGMYNYMKADEAMLRQYHIIDPAVPVDQNASIQEKMLAFTGRQP